MLEGFLITWRDEIEIDFLLPFQLVKTTSRRPTEVAQGELISSSSSSSSTTNHRRRSQFRHEMNTLDKQTIPIVCLALGIRQKMYHTYT